MAKVIGVGGIFFKSRDPAALLNWYRDVLGLQVHDWGGVFMTPDAMAAHPGAGTVFAPFKQDTTYFEPSTKDFMINLAVDDLDGILASCARHGVEAKVLPPAHSFTVDSAGDAAFPPKVDPGRTSMPALADHSMLAGSVGGTDFTFIVTDSHIYGRTMTLAGSTANSS